MKTGRIVAHENLHVSDVTIGKQNCSIIPKEKFGNLSAISADDGVSFRLFRALYSHKAQCLNQ